MKTHFCHRNIYRCVAIALAIAVATTVTSENSPDVQENLDLERQESPDLVVPEEHEYNTLFETPKSTLTQEGEDAEQNGSEKAG